MSSFPAAAAAALQQAFGLVEKQVLSGTAASITFSGIDTANKMFRLSIYIVNDANAKRVLLRLNNDSGANYDYQRLFATASSVTGVRDTGQTSISLNPGNFLGNAQHFTGVIVVGKQQTGDEALTVSEAGHDGGSGPVSENVAGIWNNTADLISRIDLIASSGNFAADTVTILEGNETI